MVISIEIKSALISAIIGALVAGIVAFGVNSYFVNQQISFDKQGAAEQFSIEIISLNDTLQAYAYEYSQNKDLTCGGSEVNIDPNKTTVLMLSGGVPYELVFNNQSITAYKGYPNYTNINSQILVVGFKFPNAPPAPRFQSCQISDPIIPPNLYNEHGMYYTYVKDVPKFNQELAKKLYVFYNDITSAEADRGYIQNYLDLNNPLITQSFKGQYFSAYMDMRMDIINASQLEPAIVQGLNQQ
jgi:hypothetical protein